MGAQGKRDDQGRDDLPALFSPGLRRSHAGSACGSGGHELARRDRKRIARLVIAVPRRSERIRWRLRHGQVKRVLDPIAETVVTVGVAADDKSPIAAASRKAARLLDGLETYVSGQSDIIIDYATAQRCEEPISTTVTESTVQQLLHRRTYAQQPMRWSPRGAHLMLKVRTSAVNGRLDRDDTVAER